MQIGDREHMSIPPRAYAAIPIMADLILLTAVWATAFWRPIFTGEFFDTTHVFSDWLRLTQPTYAYTGASLARGEFPLWNVHWFAGYPHFAVPSNAVLYPATILFALLSFVAACKITILGHILLFTVLNYFLGRDLFGSRLSALFLALSALLGVVVSGPTHGGHLWSLATITWTPLAFLALRRIVHSGRAVWALVAAAAIALMALAGDPAIFIFMLVLMAVHTAGGLLVKIFRGEPRAQIFRIAVLGVGAATFGLALAAVQLVPGQEFIGESVRRNGVTFNYLRGPFPGGVFSYFKDAAINSMGPYSYVAGKVTLAFAIAGLVGYAAGEVAFIWLATLLFWAMGGMTEHFYESVLRHVPVLNGFRAYPFSYSIFYAFYLLAAFGFDSLVASARSKERSRAPWVVAAALAAGFSVWAAVRGVPFATAAATVPLLLALTGWVLWKRPNAVVAGVALLGLVGAEGIARFRGSYTYADPKDLEINPTIERFSSMHTDVDRILLLAAMGSGIPQGPSVGLLTGDRNVEGYHALFLYRYAKLLRDVADVPIAKLAPDGRLDEQGDYGLDWVNAAALPVLDLLNVRYVLRNGGVSPFIKSEIDRGSGRFSFQILDRLRVYKNHAALPPVFPIHEVVSVSDEEEAVSLFRGGTFDYRKSATLVIDKLPVVTPATGPEPITITQYGPNAIEAKVSLTAPALLVLSEMWYPGWYAQIDGGPAQATLCVDIALQATPVPAGDHTVRFFFRPQSFINGLIISAVAALLWLACAIFLFRRRNKK